MNTCSDWTDYVFWTVTNADTNRECTISCNQMCALGLGPIRHIKSGVGVSRHSDMKHKIVSLIKIVIVY